MDPDLLTLMTPMETGQALVDYLQNERPRTANSSVFVPRLGDHDRPMTAGAVRGVIRWAYQRIGLTHSRSHALRHAFACRLVENGSSLKEVAEPGSGQIRRGQQIGRGPRNLALAQSVGRVSGPCL